MLSFLFAIVAGAAMSVQGVMNTRLSDGVGLWESSTLVQAVALVLSAAVMLIVRQGDWSKLGTVPWYAYLGGVLGTVITVTVMLSLKGLSTTVAISAILIAQLLVAALIDAFGWMGQEKVAMDWRQYVGVALMLGGVVLFKQT